MKTRQPTPSGAVRLPEAHLLGRLLRSVGIACGGYLLLWLAMAAPASAQEAPPPISLGPGLAGQLRYFNIRIASGRVVARSERSGRNISSTSRSNDRQERLVLNLSSDSPSISYQLSTSQWEFSFELENGSRLIMTRKPRSGSDVVPLEFVQPAQGPLRLTVGEGEQQHQVVASSLWLLFMTEPVLCGSELAPLLQLLHPEWDLPAVTDSIRTAMYRNAEAVREFDLASWQSLVDSLASGQFSERQAADRRLRSLGAVALPYLRGLSRDMLDAEQAFRVRQIVRDLEGGIHEDSVESVASWLAADPRAWYAVLLNADVSRHRMATEQLATLLGQEVDYDPTADSPQREVQLARIAALIERISPLPAGNTAER